MKMPTIKQAMTRADKKRFELPRVIQVRPSDWDTIILTKEIRRLQRKQESKTK
jgi:2-oxo-4-hydroxy-4-carboxy--5-ureidoimidazoline (OHCU) decarboxylase